MIEVSSGGYLLIGHKDHDGFLLRTDTNGTVLWNQTYDVHLLDELYEVIECSTGGFALIGRTFGTAPGQVWLLRVDSAGEFLWNHTYEGTSWGKSIIECADGGFVLGGEILHIMCVNATGNPLWNYTLEETDGGSVTSLKECQNGDLAFTGYIDTNPSSEWRYKLWLGRMNRTGTLLWNYTFGEEELNIGRTLVECSNGDLAAAGEKGSHWYYPRYLWLLRTFANGSLQWEKTYGEGYAHGVDETPLGLVLAGYYHDRAEDAVCIRTDDTGNLMWRCILSGAQLHRAEAVVFCNNGNIAVAGYTFSEETSLDFFL
jgi:hypothetical protein